MKIIHSRLIQFDVKDENGKYYTIDNIPDNILIEEFYKYYTDSDYFNFSTMHNYSDYYPITDVFEERCSRLNFSYLRYTKDCEGYLVIYNCRELLHDHKSCLHIPGNYVTLNDIINSHYIKIVSEFYPMNMFVKPLTDEVKNYLKLNGK